MTMTPEYLRELADLADPDELWRLPGLRQLELKPELRKQLDAGVALRRYASHIADLRHALNQEKSLLITPLGIGSTAIMTTTTPPRHRKLREQQKG